MLFICVHLRNLRLNLQGVAGLLTCPTSFTGWKPVPHSPAAGGDARPTGNTDWKPVPHRADGFDAAEDRGAEWRATELQLTPLWFQRTSW